MKGSKAELRRKRRHGHAGGNRPEQKPRTFRDGVWIEKVCVRCELMKPASAFYRTKGKRGQSNYRVSGLSSYCKECSSEMSKTSVRRFREEAVERSYDLRNNVGLRDGKCRGVLNLGGFSPVVRCSRQPAPGTGGYCLTHVPREKREAARNLAKVVRGELPFGSARWRAKQQIKLQETIAADSELTELVAEQERDARTRTIGARWNVPLDALTFDGEGDPLVDSLISGGDEFGYGVGFVYRKREQWQIGPDAPWVEPLLRLIDHKREIDAMAA